MITIDETANVSSEAILNDLDMQQKMAVVKESLERGEVPEDLKNFLDSLNRDDGPSDEELLEDDVDSDIDESSSLDIMDSPIEQNGLDIDADVSVDDLNDIF